MFIFVDNNRIHVSIDLWEQDICFYWSLRAGYMFLLVGGNRVEVYVGL